MLEGNMQSSNHVSYNKMKKDVQIYLLSRKALVIDLCVSSQSGPTFAVIKPTDLFDWGPTWVRLAAEDDREDSPWPGLILDMQCRGNVNLLKEVLADWKVLKAGFVFANGVTRDMPWSWQKVLCVQIIDVFIPVHPRDLWPFPVFFSAKLFMALRRADAFVCVSSQRNALTIKWYLTLQIPGVTTT